MCKSYAAKVQMYRSDCCQSNVAVEVHLTDISRSGSALSTNVGAIQAQSELVNMQAPLRARTVEHIPADI